MDDLDDLKVKITQCNAATLKRKIIPTCLDDRQRTDLFSNRQSTGLRSSGVGSDPAFQLAFQAVWCKWFYQVV